MLSRHLFPVLSALASPALGLDLSVADCAAIEAAYGARPSQCQGSATPSNGTNPVAAVIEPSVQTVPITPVQAITAPTSDMRQNNIFFTASGTELDATARIQIQRLADLLNSPAMERVCLKLVGHSDSTGSNLVNLEVGSKRALAVRNHLGLLLNDPNRIESVQSLGEDSPLPGLQEGSPWQRRVTLWVRDCPRS